MREKAVKHPDAPPFPMDRATVLMFAVFWASLCRSFVSSSSRVTDTVGASVVVGIAGVVVAVQGRRSGL